MNLSCVFDRNAGFGWLMRLTRPLLLPVELVGVTHVVDAVTFWAQVGNQSDPTHGGCWFAFKATEDDQVRSGDKIHSRALIPFSECQRRPCCGEDDQRSVGQMPDSSEAHGESLSSEGNQPIKSPADLDLRYGVVRVGYPVIVLYRYMGHCFQKTDAGTGVRYSTMMMTRYVYITNYC